MAGHLYLGYAAEDMIRAWWPPAVFVVLWWAVALAAYSHVASPMPMHFGIGGVADRYAEPTLGLWLLLPVVGAGLTLVLLAVGATAGRYPSMIHLGMRSGADVAPSKHGELRQIVEEMMSSMSLCVLVALASIHAGVFSASGTTHATLPGWSQLTSALAVFAVTIFIVRFAVRAGALLNPSRS